MSIFTEVKEQIKLWDATEYYGLHINRAGFTNCPFHQERTPSMKLYDDHFYCFGCQRSRDVITLVEKLCGIYSQSSIDNDACCPTKCFGRSNGKSSYEWERSCCTLSYGNTCFQNWEAYFLSQAIPEDVVNSFQSVLESIFLSTNNKVMQTIRLSEEAKIIIENYFMENEKLLADSKENKELLSGETIQNATEIGRYFYAHAKYAYDVMDSGNTLKMAEYVLSKLRQSNKTQITRRELFRSCRGSYFKQVGEIKPILDMVEEYGYIRQETVAKTGTNRPSEMIYISPYLYGRKGQQGQ